MLQFDEKRHSEYERYLTDRFIFNIPLLAELPEARCVKYDENKE